MVGDAGRTLCLSITSGREGSKDLRLGEKLLGQAAKGGRGEKTLPLMSLSPIAHAQFDRPGHHQSRV